MEDQKALERAAVVFEILAERDSAKNNCRFTCNFADTVNDIVNKFLANGVMATSICQTDKLPITPTAKLNCIQLLAASSFPLIRSSGWNSWRYVPVRISSIG
jgi:hypothetical protein